MIKQKKGELSDMLVWIITIFILAIGLFSFIFLIPQLTGGLRIAGMNNSVEGANAISSLDSLTGVINNGFMILFVGLIISMFITSFMVRTHPIFLFLYIFFLAVTVLLGFYLGNAYEQFIQNPIFAQTINQASYINLMMSHIAEIAVGVGAVSMIIVFAKFSTFGGSQQF